MLQNKPKILAIVGPTAAGKTALAIRLAKRFSGEVVSCDSRQVYQGLDIGTAKEKNFPQHLIDILSPKQVFSVARFKNLALKKVREILKKKKLPILVGGSGLYFTAVVYNLKFPKVRPDPKLRAELEKLPLVELQEKLKQLDPQAAEITAQNKRRIIRAIEVIVKTGHYFSYQRQKGEPLFDALIIGLRAPREILYQRINKRIDRQIETGLIEEVRALVKKYGKEAFALKNTIAYKEFLPYLAGKITLEKAIAQAKRNSRRFARRQIAWFKMQPNIHWVSSLEDAENMVGKWL